LLAIDVIWFVISISYVRSLYGYTTGRHVIGISRLNTIAKDRDNSETLVKVMMLANNTDDDDIEVLYINGDGDVSIGGTRHSDEYSNDIDLDISLPITVHDDVTFILDFNERRIEVWKDTIPYLFQSFERIPILKGVTHSIALYIDVQVEDGDPSSFTLTAPLTGQVPKEKYPLLTFPAMTTASTTTSTATGIGSFGRIDVPITILRNQLSDATTTIKELKDQVAARPASTSLLALPPPSPNSASSISNINITSSSLGLSALSDFKGGVATLTPLDRDSMYDQSFEHVRNNWKVVIIYSISC
jgi:hypothetical protein